MNEEKKSNERKALDAIPEITPAAEPEAPEEPSSETPEETETEAPEETETESPEETPAAEPEAKEGTAAANGTKKKKSGTKPNRPKTVAVRTLQQEIKRWQKLKITDQMCLKLMRLYLGEPDHLDENGIYRMNSLFQMSAHLCNKQSRKLIDAICLSGSFYFLVKADYSKVYGFFSPLTINEKGLENYGIPNEELAGVPLANLRLVNLRQPTRKFTTGNKEYIILMSIETKDNHFPPSEDTRLPGLRAEGLLPWDTRPEQTGAAAGGKSGRTEAGSGSAAEFFHEMKLSEYGQKTVIDPLRNLILKHYSLTRGEANVVLGNLVVRYLIPMFDHHPKFRNTSVAGRVRWLHALINRGYFVHTLQHAYECSQAQLVEYRHRQTEELLEQKRKSLRSYRPLSPYEWTNTSCNERRYEEADGQVVDLPADAPARPSATASWNPFLEQWEEPDEANEVNTTSETDTPDETDTTDGTDPTDGTDVRDLLDEVLNQMEAR